MQRLSSYSSRLIMHANSSSTRHEPRLNRACEVSSSWGAFPLKRTIATKTANRAFIRTLKEGQAHVAASAIAQQAAERAGSNAAASTSDASASEPILTRKQSQEAVADKLIDLFATKTPAEWRKLVAFSKQWASLADRCAAASMQSFNAVSIPVSSACTAAHHLPLALPHVQQSCLSTTAVWAVLYREDSMLLQCVQAFGGAPEISEGLCGQDSASQAQQAATRCARRAR